MNCSGRRRGLHESMLPSRNLSLYATCRRNFPKKWFSCRGRSTCDAIFRSRINLRFGWKILIKSNRNRCSEHGKSSFSPTKQGKSTLKFPIHFSNSSIFFKSCLLFKYPIQCSIIYFIVSTFYILILHFNYIYYQP